MEILRPIIDRRKSNKTSLHISAALLLVNQRDLGGDLQVEKFVETPFDL